MFTLPTGPAGESYSTATGSSTRLQFSAVEAAGDSSSVAAVLNIQALVMEQTMANGQEPKGADPTNHATPHAQPASGQAPIHRHVGGWVVLALGLLLLGLVQGVLRPRGQASGLDASEISLSINLNTATVAELCCIPHVGPKLAERIVAYREANGPFRSLADLDSVPGVGASLLEEISQAIEPLPGDQSPMTLWPSPSAATR